MALPWRGSTVPGAAAGGGEARSPQRRAPFAPAVSLRDAAAAWCRQAVLACGAFEWTALGYLGVTGVLLIVFHRHVQGAWRYLCAQAGVAALIVALSWAAQRSGSAAIRFARHWYPPAFFLFCFEELHYLAHLVFPGWFDRWLIALDYWLAGVHPTVWLEQFARPALNEFMQMAYISYFFYLVVLAGLLYARRELRSFWAVMTSSVVAYATGYLIAIVFPIESPYHSLAALQTVELEGGLFTSLIGLIERFGRVHGGAFPSSHVSGSLVALLGAWRYRRWLFWVFLPFFLCLLVSTVYGRYHYIADVLGGLVTGAFGFWLGHKLMRLRGACPDLTQ